MADAISLILEFAMLVFLLILIYINIVGTGRLYKKANQKEWYILIPYYNVWILTKISGLSSLWFVLLLLLSFASTFIPILSILVFFVIINVNYNLAKKFHKSDSWFVLSIFFGFVMVPYLGMSKKETYDESVVVSENGMFGAKKVNNQNYQMNENTYNNMNSNNVNNVSNVVQNQTDSNNINPDIFNNQNGSM